MAHRGCCCQVPIPHGHHEGFVLADLLRTEQGVDWIAWAMRRRFGYWPRWFQEALIELVETHDLVPEILEPAEREQDVS